MSASPENSAPHFTVAIVGAGPSGFYAADCLLRSDLPIVVDVYERLAAPYGLVRYGVAPDHPRLKATIKVFERIARHDRFSFLGNLDVGTDVMLDDLRSNYDAVILAHGSRRGRALEIPGGSLPGCHTATDFVGWYNGHPDFADLQFNLDTESVAIVGNGNVALDLARILVQPLEALRQTDIAAHALEALDSSRVRDVHLIGRRGPAQAAFTNTELREIGEIPGVTPMVDVAQLEPNAATRAELADRKNFLTCKNLDYLRDFSARKPAEAGRRIFFHFLRSPLEASGSEAVEGLTLAINQLEGDPFKQRAVASRETQHIACGLLLGSIGYRGEPISALPFDGKTGTYRNNEGRVDGETGLFTAGWIKRGPSGIIGTNKACSNETVAHVLDYLERSAAPGTKKGFAAFEHALGQQVVSFDSWSRLDQMEIDAGTRLGKPREKILDFPAAIASL